MEGVRFIAVLATFLMCNCLLQCEGQCPQGWKNFQNTSCYFISADSLSWAAARTNCTSMGGHLVKITSQLENNFIKKEIGGVGVLWIGGFLDMTNSLGYRFVWSDWTSIGYTKWQPGQPDTADFHGAEACVDISSPDGNWTDNLCLIEQQYICEKSPDPCQVNNGGCPHTCSNINGKAVCSCKKGFASIANGTECLDLEKALTQNGTWEIPCGTESNSSFCACLTGFKPRKMGGIRTCKDINECSNNNGGCQHACSNTPGGYQCSCDPGFLLNKDHETCTNLASFFKLLSGVDVKSCSVEDCRCPDGYKIRNLGSVSMCFAVPPMTDLPTTSLQSFSIPTEINEGFGSPGKLHGENRNNSSPIQDQTSLLSAVMAVLIILLAVVIFSVMYLVYYLPRMRTAGSLNAKYQPSKVDENVKPDRLEFSNPVYNENYEISEKS